MPVGLSASVKAKLATRDVHVAKRLKIISQLLNLDLYAEVDVTERVLQWGVRGGQATIVSDDWTIPGMTLTVSNQDGRFTRGEASSVWTELGAEPEDCHIEASLWVTDADGAMVRLDQYIGLVDELVAKEEGDDVVVDIVTRMAGAKLLDEELTKESGDRQIILRGDL